MDFRLFGQDCFERLKRGEAGFTGCRKSPVNPEAPGFLKSGAIGQ